MGGHAFKHLDLTPIYRTQIESTVKFIVDELAASGFTYDYAMANIMGSAGKQDYSNDLDFALNDIPCKLIGQEQLPIFYLKTFNNRCIEVLGPQFVNSDTMAGGQINTAWPINGKADNGYIQVDFICGNPSWLKFTHFSPGRDVSRWKGVFISTMLGVLAKRKVDFVLIDDNNVLAKVGFFYHLEKGLHRTWRLFDHKKRNLALVSADVFETNMPLAPRFARTGYIDNPETVLRILFDRGVDPASINTFEKLVRTIYNAFPAEFDIIKERFVEAIGRSSGRRHYSLDEVRKHNVWRCDS